MAHEQRDWNVPIQRRLKRVSPQEMGHMIEALHEVEADFDNLCRQHSRDSKDLRFSNLLFFLF